MASVGYAVAEVGACRRGPIKLRRTVYLTIIIITLTTALYSLRDLRRADSGLTVKPRQADDDISRLPKHTDDGSKPGQVSTRRTTTESVNDASIEITSKSPVTGSTMTTSARIVVSDGSMVVDNVTMKTEATTAGMPRATTSGARSSSTQPATTMMTTVAPTLKITTVKMRKKTTTTTTPEPTQPVTTVPALPTATPTPDFCEEPAYHEFPADVFTNRQRAKGAVVIHILIGIYMFYALAVVCDEYFVAAMEKMCDSMGLSEDVAGATFMAAGSSAPELFASLLGVFVAKGDVGTGTIVGSAVFNVLFVIGFCAYFCGRTMSLNWWPLLRDSAYYSLTVIVLIIVLADGYVTWLESTIMLILYAVYIVLMKHNVKLRIWLTENTQLRVMDDLTECTQGILQYDDKQIQSSYVQFANDATVADEAIHGWKTDDPSQLDLDEVIRYFPRKKVSLYVAALMIMMTRDFRALTRFRFAAKRIITERRLIRREGYPQKAITINECHYPNPILIGHEIKKDSREAWKKAPSVEMDGLLAVINWFVTIPVLATLYYTIPDCRTARWERHFLFTFLTAIIWIAFFSYILVWMVTLVGYTLGIPDTIMGITFLAAGTSVPDAYASLLVAKQGMADMAVANSLGSNVFDILIGLALPWFLKTAVTDPNSMVRIRSSGMVYSVALLFLSIFATIGAVHHCRWQMDRRLGVILLACYAVFLFFAILIECNVFGFVNYPECEE